MSASERYVLGYWNVNIDPASLSAEIEPNRTGNFHVNAVRLLEEYPCTDCLKIKNIHPVSPSIISVDVEIRHPFTNTPKLTAFDVRGIIITGSDFTFPANGRKIALGDKWPKVANPDGYTSLFNPTDFPASGSNPPVLKYYPGKFSMGSNFNATLNPFVAYCIDEPRRMFTSGNIATRTILIEKPIGKIQFGYAVDLSWMYVEKVTNPEIDFPKEANCLEAYNVSIANTVQIGHMPDSYSMVRVKAIDWQGAYTISYVSVEMPDLFEGELKLELESSDLTGTSFYSGVFQNALGADIGIYPLLIRVADTKPDPIHGHIDAWNVAGVSVVEFQGWAKTWGGWGVDEGHSVACDGSGNVYVAGNFIKTVDFDPGPGEELHTSVSSTKSDAFVSKFDPNGNFQWVKVWGGTGEDRAYDLACDGKGYIYIAGSFEDTVEFTALPGGSMTSNGGKDCYYCVFDQAGQFSGHRAWGSEYPTEEALAIHIDQYSNIFITGQFGSTVDFNPSGGYTLERTSNGGTDVFLSTFDCYGNLIWAQTWGGADDDIGLGVTVYVSAYKWRIFVTGGLRDLVDLDPGIGVTQYDSKGESDAFVSEFDNEGNFVWGCGWGSSSYDFANEVVVDSTGKAYVYGWFRGIADLDPGPGVDERNSHSSMDCFLIKFDQSGFYEWGLNWDGEDNNPNLSDDCGTDLTIDPNDNLYVTGWFEGQSDLDPGKKYDIHVSKGKEDAFISKFDTDGNYQWARNWGGTGEYEMGLGVTTDLSGNIYVTGNFQSITDFDPGPGIDEHSTNGTDDAFLIKILPNGYW
ncbi:MAG: hypothetical protein ABIC40_00055 [bacterium]